MFEAIFIDLPLVLAGYAGMVFLIMKYLGDTVHDAGAVVTSKTETPAAPAPAARALEPEISEILTAELSEAPVASKSATDEVMDESYPDFLPTDAQLRRHYLTNLLTIATTLHPRPEEATLRRHHRQLALSLVEGMLEHPQTIEALEDLARERNRLVAPVSAFVAADIPVPSDAAAPAIELPELPEPTSLSDRLTLPEESTLRRHVIQQLLARVEEVFPRPAESTLRRHYDQWLASEVEDLVLHQGG